ncbi:MAG TPA: hypothetical protein VNQ77_02040 [Frankiaceae bacterium]|nr:hypothetical protein [Frankiaceae bacterium]
MRELLSTVTAGRTAAVGLAVVGVGVALGVGLGVGVRGGCGEGVAGRVNVSPGSLTTAGESRSAGTSHWRATMPPETRATARTPPSALRSAGWRAGVRTRVPVSA